MCLQTLLVMHEFGQLRKAGQPGEENVSVHQHEKKKKKISLHYYISLVRQRACDETQTNHPSILLPQTLAPCL